MNSGRSRTALRRYMKALRRGLRLLWRELSRLNSQGVEEIEQQAPRTTRSAAFRALIAQKYRDRSTCC
jgi:hypothetical protein